MMTTWIARLKARMEELKDSYGRLTAREKLSLGALALVFATIVLGGIAYWVVSDLDALAGENAATRQALRELEKNQDLYQQNKRRAARLEQAIAEAPLELNSHADRAASAAGVKIDESAETPSLTAAGVTRRGLEIKLRKVHVGPLTELLKRLEITAGRLVQVTDLSVNTRWNQHDELDVELVVTTYERAPRKGSEGSAEGRSTR